MCRKAALPFWFSWSIQNQMLTSEFSREDLIMAQTDTEFLFKEQEDGC